MGVLNGKVALVSGASKGIGAGIAKVLAEQGAAVVVNYASSKEGADRVVAEIASMIGGNRLQSLCADWDRQFLWSRSHHRRRIGVQKGHENVPLLHPNRNAEFSISRLSAS